MEKPGTTKNNDDILILAVLFYIFLAVHALFVFFFNEKSNGYYILERTWGLDHLSYFSVPFALLFYLVGFLITLPLINLKLSVFVKKTIDAQRHVVVFLRNHKYFLFCAVSLASVILFYLFRIKYNLLGNTLIRVDQTLNKNFFFLEYGTMFTLHYVCKIFKLLGIEARQVFVFQSIIAGGCFIFVALLVADSLGRTFLQKVAIFLFSTTVGTVQLFFGYPEVYAIPALFSLIYFYCCILYIKGKVRLFVPFTALIVCLVFHLISLAMIPSFFVLIYYKDPNYLPVFNWLKEKKHRVILFISFFPLLYIVAFILSYDLMPVFSSLKQPHQMTLLSVAHFWEFFNSQLLASGSGIFLFIYLLYKFIKGEIRTDPILLFLTTGAVFSLLLLFAFNAILGSNGWDILTFPAIIYNLLGMYCLVSTYLRRSMTVRYVVPILIFLNIMNSVPWVLVNASDRSVQRIKKTLPTDPGSYWISHPPVMHLAIAFNGNGLHKEAFEYHKKFYNKNPEDVRAHLNYATQLLKKGNRDEAIKILENLVEMAPQYPLAYQVLIPIYEQAAQPEKTYAVVKKFFAAFSQDPRPFLTLMSEKELVNYLTFLYKIEIARENHSIAEAVKKMLNVTARHFKNKP